MPHYQIEDSDAEKIMSALRENNSKLYTKISMLASDGNIEETVKAIAKWASDYYESNIRVVQMDSGWVIGVFADSESEVLLEKLRLDF